MKKLLLASTAIAAMASTAFAGGLERTTQSMNILFEEGRYMELSFGIVAPDVSGFFGPAPSGDMLSTFSTLGLAYKADLNENLSYAIIFDQPYGADTDYPTGTGNPFAGSTAEVNSNAISGVLQYNMGNGASIYGGLRAQTLQAEAAILPTTANYTVESDTNFQLGYLVGAAYEKPEIALRVALTYHSEITHDLRLDESLSGGAITDNQKQDVVMPQALNLEFQSGVAEDTLVFGSVRWVEWSETVVNPPVYSTNIAPVPLVFFEDDRITYTLGMGRRLNDTWSVLGSVSYEENTGSATGNLGPTDGFTAVSLGAVYTKDNMKITGGVRYADIGDATSFNGQVFENNDAIAAGVRIGWQF